MLLRAHLPPHYLPPESNFQGSPTLEEWGAGEDYSKKEIVSERGCL